MHQITSTSSHFVEPHCEQTSRLRSSSRVRSGQPATLWGGVAVRRAHSGMKHSNLSVSPSRDTSPSVRGDGADGGALTLDVFRFRLIEQHQLAAG